MANDYIPGNWNVIADGWWNGTYCLGMNVSKECAERWAKVYTEKYENKPYPNGKGHYSGANFRIVEIIKE